MGVNHNSPGFFAITKGKILVVLSLALTWWAAFLLPHYTPNLQYAIKSRLQEARQKIPAIKVDWHRDPEPRSNYNASKIAMLIEARPLPHLVPQMLHMLTVIPPDWRMVFIGSNKSVVSVGRSFAVKHQQVIGKLDLMVLPEPWDIGSKEQVYRLMTDLRFYDEFLPGVEWILKYEYDSILCANAEESLNDWLHWSWAGAPRSPEDRFSGNGGLSLRKMSAIRKVLNFQQRRNDSDPEDEWFGKRLWILPGEKVASGPAGALAVEDVYFNAKPMGFHLREGGKRIHDNVWKDAAQRKKILTYCPEVSLVMDMKLERERCEGDNKDGTIGPSAEELEAKKKEEEEDEKKKKAEEEKKKKEEKKKQQEDATADGDASTKATPTPQATSKTG